MVAIVHRKLPLGPTGLTAPIVRGDLVTTLSVWRRSLPTPHPPRRSLKTFTMNRIVRGLCWRRARQRRRAGSGGRAQPSTAQCCEQFSAASAALRASCVSMPTHQYRRAVGPSTVVVGCSRNDFTRGGARRARRAVGSSGDDPGSSSAIAVQRRRSVNARCYSACCDPSSLQAALSRVARRS